MHPSLDHKEKMQGDAKKILSSITDAFFSLNTNWEFSYLNPQAEEILGKRVEDMLGKSIWTEFPGVAGSEFERMYRKVASERVPTSFTSYYADHDRWYEVHAYPAADGISIYFQNVTDRIRAVERLRESETRFRLMADAIPQIVWITDAAGRIEFFNQQWSDYAGIAFDPATATEISAGMLHPDDHALTLDAWDVARRDGSPFLVEHRMRAASGDYRWFLVRAEPYREPGSGQIMRWFGTSTDVHDRKLVEAALKKSEERYRTLFNSLDEGFCVIEMIFEQQGKAVDYRFLEVNPTFQQQTGLDQPIGKTIRELVPQHESHWFDIYGAVALTGVPVRFQNEAKALNRWYDVYAFRIDEPHTHRVAVLFNDITLRRHTEESLRMADRRKDEFLAMLAHELRNPLAPISAAADLLRLSRLDETRVRKTSEIISRQVRHMTSLVDDLLDVSRVTRGLINPDMVALDVKRIVSDAIEQVRSLIEARLHYFAVHMPPESAFVLGDQKRLVQVIANLLNNAAKYTPEGGNIVLKMEVHDEQVVIAVADNGIGMAPELVSHSFELFAQAERTSDRSQGGLGIGLALVKSLVELHQGRVTAHSEGAGEGSEFTIFLPRITTLELPSAPAQQGTKTAARSGLRLMVVDDNADAASMLAMFLESSGHDVIVEHDSTAAIERSRSATFDAFLLDIGLPDIDGNELARRLRSQPETANSLLVAVTGYGQEHDKINSAAAGFDHHFVKPVDTAKLAVVLAGLGA